MNRFAKILTVGLLVLVASGTGVTLWSHHGAQQITAVADQLRIPTGWVVLSQQVQGPKLLCIGDVACPSLSRHWQAPANLSTAAFKSLLTSSGWDLTVRSSCEPRSNGNTWFQSCSARGVVEGYQAAVYYQATGDEGTLDLLLQRPFDH